jgi:hypothetical protein
MTREEFDSCIKKKLPSDLFTADCHTSDNLTLSIDVDDMRDSLERANLKILGYSKAKQPQRPDEYGLMLESQDTFEKFWYHVDYRYFRKWKEFCRDMKDKGCRCSNIETYLEVSGTEFENGQILFCKKIYGKCPNCGRKYVKTVRNGIESGWKEINNFQTSIRESK